VNPHLNRQNAEYFIREILAGNRVALSRAITLCESSNKEKQLLSRSIIDGILHKTGRSFRLGITGVPGVGKSTFIESFGKVVLAKGYRLAVLAIDPSSAKTGGSILGDKTRMAYLSTDDRAFIRPSPTSGALGGVTRATFEAILLCEAAGFDFIMVETVGVGQSEIAVGRLTDFFLLLMLAGAGDELQGIKRGIMEMADAVVITKADGANVQQANAARSEYDRALHYFPRTNDWVPRAMICSAVKNEGITGIFEMITEFINLKADQHHIKTRRTEQRRELLLEALSAGIIDKYYGDHQISEWLERISSRENINPYSEVAQLLERK
jgi:LAO/AO transport system kinase